MCRLLLAMVVLSLPGSVFSAEPVSDADQIKALIPSRTSMDRAAFEQIAQGTTAPREADLEDKNLTWLLFSLDPATLENAGDQFRFLTDRPPKPSELAREMYRSIGQGRFRIVTAPVTMIHAERITDFKVDIKDNRATGSFAFKVPRLYEGKADFVAHRRDGKWSIDEFAMPKLKLHIVREEDYQSFEKGKREWSHKAPAPE